MLKIQTCKNQMPTTKTMLPKYQNNSWAKLNEEELLIYIKLKMIILNKFTNRKDANEIKSILILFPVFILGVERFNINNK